MSLNKPKIYLPLMDNGQGSCRTHFLENFIKAFAAQHVHIARVSDSHPGRGRNRAAADFLATGCDYLLFIDADIIFDRGHIERLMESAEPVLGGIYCLKTMVAPSPCLQTLPGAQPIAVGGIEEVRRTGTGFLRIHRSVFEAIKPHTAKYNNHGRDEWDFFPSGVVDEEWLSEDWYFCDLARKAGFRVMVDTTIQVGHEGNVIFPVQQVPDRLNCCPQDMKPHMELIWKGEYEVPLDVAPRTILDIGGNIGGFTVWAKEQWRDATVYAYEPSRDNAALFRFNTAQFKNVTLTEAGVRAEAGIQWLSHGTNCGEHSFKFESQTGEKVPVLAAKHMPACELVKLDCEGCELEILRELDLSEALAVVLEYHTQDDRTAIAELMTTRGFHILDSKPVAAGRGILKFTRQPNTQTQ